MLSLLAIQPSERPVRGADFWKRPDGRILIRQPDGTWLDTFTLLRVADPGTPELEERRHDDRRKLRAQQRRLRGR